MWADFNNSFTVVFLNELQKNVVLDLPPHLKYVVALPRETLMTVMTLLSDGSTAERLHAKS